MVHRVVPIMVWLFPLPPRINSSFFSSSPVFPSKIFSIFFSCRPLLVLFNPLHPYPSLSVNSGILFECVLNPPFLFHFTLIIFSASLSSSVVSLSLLIILSIFIRITCSEKYLLFWIRFLSRLVIRSDRDGLVFHLSHPLLVLVSH